MDAEPRFGDDGEVVRDILLKVSYREPTELLADYLTELGRGGLFIRTDADFQVGRKLAFSLSFPGLLEPVDLEGIVRFRQEAGETPGALPGVGVEILTDDVAGRRALERLVRRLRIRADWQQRPRDVPFRVLLVEDNDFVRDLFEHALTRFYDRVKGSRGALQVTWARDGQEALAALDAGPVDLAIVDHFLPVMTGAGVIAQLRARPKLADIPVLMVSTGGDDVRAEALAAGADLFVHKPVLRAQLLNTLGHLLGLTGDLDDATSGAGPRR